MTTYLINLTSSCLYPSPRHLIYAVQHAKSAPPDTRYLIGEWSDKLTPAEYLAWFRRKLNEKINFHEAELHYIRKRKPEYQLGLRRDAARLSGYGGFGHRLETPEVRKRLNADHVHYYINGRHRTCGDPDCDNLY